ncbi:hypothetical protein JW906_06390, partial [bacterium]|nr:hypothetical protein [bacterium]
MRINRFPALVLAVASMMGHPASGDGRIGPSLMRKLRGLSASQPSGCSARKAGGSLLDVIVQTNDPERLRQAGIQVRSVSGDIAVVSAGPGQITEMKGMSCVVYMDAPAVCRPSLDVSTDSMGIAPVHAGDLGRPFTGTGVIIGLCDSGIDWRHPDFIRPDGSSRIL